MLHVRPNLRGGVIAIRYLGEDGSALEIVLVAGHGWLVRTCGPTEDPANEANWSQWLGRWFNDDVEITQHTIDAALELDANDRALKGLPHDVKAPLEAKECERLEAVLGWNAWVDRDLLVTVLGRSLGA